jgi:hypothetical protein
VDPTPFVGREDTVCNDGVEVKVEVQAAAEPLDVVDRGRPASGDPCRPFLLEGDRLDEDASERSRFGGAKRGQAAKLEREREDPLPDWHCGQDTVDDVRSGVAHPARATARADAASLACERDEEIAAASVAMKPQKAMREDAALEVRAEGLFHVARQAAIVGLAGVREEGIQVIAYDSVEDGLRRTARHVAGRYGAAWVGDVPGCGLGRSTWCAPRRHDRGAMAILVP